ncbi:MAG TPA: folate family ECF transporter S component [Firmicutes bacterium]|nr:folate family ECF transporter S component [Bacillota bacterium]
MHSKTVSRIGILVALSVILTRYFGFMVNVAGVIGLRISFGEVPIMVSGILLGPAVGAVTGILSDLIGYMLNPAGGPYYPGFTLTAALEGVLPSIVLSALGQGQRGKPKGSWSFPKILLAVAITGVSCSTLLNTFWIHRLYGKAFVVLLPSRIVARAFLIPVHSMVIHVLVRAFTPSLSQQPLGQAGNTGA